MLKSQVILLKNYVKVTSCFTECLLTAIVLGIEKTFLIFGIRVRLGHRDAGGSPDGPLIFYLRWATNINRSCC